MDLLIVLGFEQAVEVLADTREMNEPAAMDVAFVTEEHGFHLSFRHEVVKSPALDPEQALHIAPTSKFRERSGVLGARYADRFCCRCFHCRRIVFPFFCVSYYNYFLTFCFFFFGRLVLPNSSSETAGGVLQLF
jgi:hypothetical protein